MKMKHIINYFMIQMQNNIQTFFNLKKHWNELDLQGIAENRQYFLLHAY